MSEMDVSLLLSVGLAITWIKGAGRANDSSEASALSALPKDLSSAAQEVGWASAMYLHGLNQVLPALLVAAAAASPWRAVSSACYVSLPEEPGTLPDDGGWLGHGQLGFARRWALLVALAVWRAEKLESLIQRMQRSVSITKSTGLGPSLKNMLADPWGWAWPAFWGVTRRFALIAISVIGCGPFLQTTFPAVVLDECLWWVLAKFQDLWSRKLTGVPPVFDVVVLPILDLLHFLPVIAKVCMLALLEYPVYEAAGSSGTLLVISAMAWTAHNCHTLYTTVCVDVPESVQQLMAARRAVA